MTARQAGGLLPLDQVVRRNPSVPRNEGPHAIHQRIAEFVGMLDELRHQVNITRLKYGDSDRTDRRLNEAIEWLNSAESMISEARACVTIA